MVCCKLCFVEILVRIYQDNLDIFLLCMEGGDTE